MVDPSEQSLGQVINTWVQTAGIIIAAGWAAYTFIYKEIVIPKSVPVNISVSLQLKKIGPVGSKTIGTKKQLVAVEMHASATNPSPREVYLLPSAWIARGYNERSSDVTLSAEAANTVLNGGQALYVEKYATAAGALIAVGNLFSDRSLKSSETITCTRIIYVPYGMFDAIVVETRMPTVAKKDVFDLEWNLKEKEQATFPIMYRLSADKKRTEMKRNPDGSYSDEESGLQLAESISEVSLWQ